MNDKDLYETLGALSEALPAHMREEFAELVREIDRRAQGSNTVRRWLRDAGFRRAGN